MSPIKNKKVFIIGALIAIIIAGAGGYMLGKKSGSGVAAEIAPQGGGQMAGRGGGGMRGGRGGGNFAGGEIISIDAQSLTVKSQDGSSKIVLFSPTTPITTIVPTSPSDLLVGKSIIVGGKANPDGSVTAESIQLRPIAPNRPITNASITQ
jgi:hypothetical protein